MKYEVIQHYVTFYSPGTFVAETTKKEIESWDVDVAIKMARRIKERYGATPYGFVFATHGRKKGELDSKEIKRSGVHYLGGKILTLEDIKKRGDPADHILISNMDINGWATVIQNDNSWRWTLPYDKSKGDRLIKYPPPEAPDA